MTGPGFRAWREGFGLTQAEVAAHFAVSRTTVQNWEANEDGLSSMLETGVMVWSRRLRQQDPLHGPVTLIVSDAPLFIPPYGPRPGPATMKQEAHTSNAAVLTRAQMLASSPTAVNAFVVEDGGRILWNIVELGRVISGEDADAPTLSNLLRRLAADIRDDAPNHVRTGARPATPAQEDQRIGALGALALQLERIAASPLLEILDEQGNVEGIRLQVQNLGLRPRDQIASGIAQAFHAARMPVE